METVTFGPVSLGLCCECCVWISVRCRALSPVRLAGVGLTLADVSLYEHGRHQHHRDQPANTL